MRETSPSPKVQDLAAIAGVDAVREVPGDSTNEPQSADLAAVWQELSSGIRRRIQPELFETWFRRAALVSLGENSVAIAVQNAFARDWLERYHRAVIEASVREALGDAFSVERRIDPELALPARATEEPSREEADRATPAALVQQGPATGGSSLSQTAGSLVHGSDVGLNAK